MQLVWRWRGSVYGTGVPPAVSTGKPARCQAAKPPNRRLLGEPFVYQLLCHTGTCLLLRSGAVQNELFVAGQLIDARC